MRRRLVLALALCGCARSGTPPPTGMGPSPADAAMGGGSPAPSPTRATATFSVWAPNATGAFVEGDFNGWGATPLAAGPGGLFSALVDGVLPGARYRYRLVTAAYGTLVRNDPRARQVAPDLTASILPDEHGFAWTDQAFHPPPFAAQVIYELHLATFVDQGVPGGGGWASAATRLDYLRALGVNMIEVMPVAQFPGRYSWGYDPIFPFAPASAYGSPEDAKRFIDGAHGRGMGVIVDIVHNHWGPDRLPMWCFDGPCLGPGNGGIYFYTDGRRETGFGPRPDFGRAEVRDFVADNARMWLGEYHADGLRWDSTVNIRRAGGQDLPDGWTLLGRINEEVDARTPERVMIAEDLQNDARLTRPTSAGGAGFDSQWDPSFFEAVRNALVPVDDGARDLRAVAAALARSFDGVASRRVIFAENHDLVAPQNGPDHRRLPALISPSSPDDVYARKRATLGAALVLTAPGIPLLFMGEEFVESLPFPFSPAAALDWSRADGRQGMVDLFRALIGLRENAGGATRGLVGDHVDVFHVNDAAKLLGYRRWDRGGPGDDVVVLANFSARAFPRYLLGLPEGGVWHVRFNGDDRSYADDFGGAASDDVVATATPRDGQPWTGSLAVGPYSAVILSR